MEYAVLTSDGLLAPVSIRLRSTMIPISGESWSPEYPHTTHTFTGVHSTASPFPFFFSRPLQLFYSYEWEGISGYFRSALCERGKTDLTEELEISNQNADNCTKIKLYIILTYIFRSTEIWEFHLDTEET